MSSTEIAADAAANPASRTFSVPTTETSALFWKLLRHYTASLNLTTAEALERMIADPALPGLLESDDVAAILGIQARSLKPKRRLKTGPPYIRQSGTVVKYPTADFIRYMIRKARN